MAYWPLEQRVEVSPVLAFPNQSKDPVECLEITIYDLWAVFRAHVDAGTGEVPCSEHLLSDERLVGERPFTGDGEPGQCRQSKVADLDAVFVGQPLPPIPDVEADACNGFPGFLPFHDLKRLQGGGGADSFGPEGAADEGSLRRLHDFASPDRRGDGVAVSKGLAEHRHVRLDPVFLVQSSKSLPESGGAFVEDQHDPAFRAKPPHLLEELVSGAHVADHLHLDHSNVMFGEQAFEFVEPIVVEREYGSLERTRYSIGAQTREEMPIEVLFIAEVRRQVPIVPSVVAADGDLVPPRRRPRDPNGNRVGLASTTCEAGHPGPWMEFDQPFGQVHLLRAIQAAHVARLHGLQHRLVHLRVPVSKSVGADAHDGHVDVFVPVQVPNLATLGFAEICGPLFGQEHLRPLGKQHVPPRDHAFGPVPKLLTRSKGGSLIAREALVGAEPSGFRALERQDLPPPEMELRREMFEDPGNDLKILGFIDRPPQRGEVGGVVHRAASENPGFPDEGGDVLMVVGAGAFLHGTLEGCERDHLDVEAIREGGWLGVAEVIHSARPGQAYALVDQFGIHQWAIARDADHDVGMMLPGGLHEAIEHIVFAALLASETEAYHMVDQGLIANVHRCGDNDPVKFL